MTDEKLPNVTHVSARTVLYAKDGEPLVLVSSARDLDAAYDAACQYIGEPLDCGSWEPTGDKDSEGHRTWCLLMWRPER